MPRKPLGRRPITAAESQQNKRREAIVETTPELMGPQITKSEQAELQKLINRREKVLKQVASARSAELMADFEQQMAAQYSFDDREVWAEATRRGQAAVDAANAMIAEECAKLGIPDQFSPRMAVAWLGRGENAFKERRDELRRLAKTRIEAIEKRALVEISQEALLAMTEILSLGLASKAAIQFLQELAPLERLMPPLDFRSVEETLIGKPIIGPHRDMGQVYQRLTVGEVPPPLSKEEKLRARFTAEDDD